MSSFLDLADPEDLRNILKAQGERLEALEKRFADLQTIGELTGDLGDIRAGRILSGEGSLDDGTFTGSAQTYPPTPFENKSYNRFVTRNGKIQFGESTDGSAVAAGGNLFIDARSLYFLANVMAQITKSTDMHIIGEIYAADDDGSTNLRFGHHSFNYKTPVTELITNGDAETGDDTGWTATGSPSIVEDSPQGTYCFSVDKNNKYSQTISTIAGRAYLLQLMSKADSDAFASVLITGADVVGFDTFAGLAWTQDFCFMKATGSSITIILKADNVYGDGQFVKFDDVSVKEVEFYSTVGNTYPYDQLELDSNGLISLSAPLVKILAALMLKEQSATPPTPPAGFGDVYLKDDGLPYALNDAGLEMLLFGSPQINRVQSIDITVPANFGLVAPYDYEIASGKVLELASGAVLDII